MEQPIYHEHSPHVIGVYGRKQSGKGTSANYIAGSILSSYGVIDNWKIGDDGKILASTVNKTNIASEIIDVVLYDNSPTVNSLLQNSDPVPANLVHIIHFADPLKIVVHELFGIPIDTLYGSDQDKQSLTNYTAQSFNKVTPVPNIQSRPLTKSKLTAREIMQLTGDIGRQIDTDLFVNRTLEKIYSLIQEWRPKCIIVPDVRYKNECVGLKEIGATLIGLTRGGGKDPHSSETENNFKYCDLVIDNGKMSVYDQCLALAPVVQNILAN